MKIKKCVILCGGLGTRLLPISKTISKEFSNINNKPSIFYQVEEAYKSGIKEIIFVCTKRNINYLKNYFSKDLYLNEIIKNDKEKIKTLKELNTILKNIKFKYCIQEIRGTYGAVYSARKYLKDEYFGLIYCDDLIDSKEPVLKQLIKEHEKTNNMIVASKEINNSNYPNFGLIKYNDNNTISDLCYKDNSKKANFIQGGRFILHTKIFKIKNKLHFINNELQLPTSLLIFNNEVRSLNYEGEYLDIGNYINLLKTNLYYSFKDENIKKEILEYIKGIN